MKEKRSITRKLTRSASAEAPGVKRLTHRARFVLRPLPLALILLALSSSIVALTSPRFAEVRKSPLSFSSYRKVFASRSARTLNVPAPVATCAWTGTISTDWSNSLNWSGCSGAGGIGPPASGDTVTIGSATNQPTVSSNVGTVGAITISAGGTLTIASGGTLSSTATMPVSGGNLVVSGGTITVGNSLGSSINLTSSGTLNVSSGTLNVAGRLTSTTGTVTISNGSLNLCTVGQSSATASFDMGGSTNLTISGGSATFQNANGSTGGDLKITSGSGTKSINGGTFQFGNASTPASQNFKINSAVSVFNIVVSSTNSPTATLQANMSVGGDLTLNGGTLDLSTFSANRSSLGGTLTIASGAALKIGGTGTIPSNYSTHSIDANSTIEFSGSNQNWGALNSSQNYGNVIISSSGTSSLTASNTVAGTLTLTSGVLSIGANTLTLNGAISTTSGTLTGGATSNISFGGSGANTTLPAVSGGLNNLTINRANGITLGGGVTVAGTLTLTNGTFTNGANLTLGNGATISRDTGTLSAAPTFVTSANVTYTGTTGVTTGNELPTSGTVLNDLTVNKSGGVSLGANATVNGTLTLTSGTFTIGANTLTINGGISAPTGTLTGGATSNITFGNTGSTTLPAVSGGLNNLTITRPNTDTITIGGAVTVGGTLATTGGVGGAGNLTLNGTCQINSGGFFNSAPNYGGASLLKYNTGGTYGRASEWLATSGAGYPHDVQLSNNTTLELSNGGLFSNSATQMSGSLTIDSGSQMQMAGAFPMNAALTVLGSVTNSGTLTLSSSSGGDVNVSGSFTNTGGTFTGNGRTLTFNGGSGQSWSDNNSQNFGAVVINNTSGGVSLGSAIQVSALTLTSGKVTTTSSNLLTVTGTAANAVSNGSASSYINGPLARVLPASLVSGTTYVFPVGKAGFNPFELVDPTTNGGGTVTLQIEETDADSGGTAGTGLSSLNTDRYWGATITNPGNFTNTKVRLTNSSALAANKRIGKSSTLTGAYDSIGGTVAGATVLSDPFSTFSFFAIGTAVQPGTLSFDDGATSNDNETNADHTVTRPINRTGGSDGIVSVHWATSDGSATTADNDYVAASGDLTWGAGDTAQKSIIFTVKGDTTFEPTETVLITLSAPTGGATISGVNPHTVNLQNDDPMPTISISDVTLAEGDSGTSAFVFTVSLSNPASTNVTVDYTTALGATNPATSGGSCGAGTDYVSLNGSVNFNPGETSNNTVISVLVCGDTTVEPDETFFVNLSNNSANSTLAPGTKGTGTITNDDTGDLEFNASGNLPAGTYNNVTINAPAVVTLTGDVIINGTITINTGGTLDCGGFNVSGPGTFTLNAGGTLAIGDVNGITTDACGTGPTCGSIRTAARTFSSSASYTYDGTANQSVGNGLPGSVVNLTIANTGSGGNNTVTGNAGQIVTGTLTVNSGIYSSASDYVDVVINNAGTLSLAADITVSGNWTNNGTFISNGFTVTFDGNANQTIGGSNSTPFATLQVSNSGTSPTNVVSLDGSLGAIATTASALSVTSGVFDQGSGASSSNFTTNGTGTVATIASGATWSNLGTGDLTLSGDVSNSGTINFNANGTACGDADSILIRSTGAARTWSGTGTFSMIDVDVKDQKVPLLPPPVFILVNSGTDSTGNTGWVFVDQCTSGTYTWIGGPNQDWQVPTNWSPTRLTPAASDNLIFDGNSTPAPTVTNVPTETDGTLRLINGVNGVTLNASAGAQTLTLSGVTGSDLSVPSGTLLTLAGANGLTISLTAAGTQGSIGGQIILQGGPHRLIGSNAGEINFASGSIFTAASSPAGFTGNPFGAGTADSVRFQSGSSAFFNAGSDPFGGSGNAVATFVSGSTQTFNASSAFSANDRTYGNLTLDGSQTYFDSTATLQVNVFNNLTIQSGSTLKLSDSSGGDLNLKGNFTDNGTFDPNSRTVKFQGGSNLQTISKSSGTESFFDVFVSLSAGGELKLLSPVTIAGQLDLSTVASELELNAQTLTLNGTITGSGVLKGDTGATLNIGGTGSLGTLNFASGTRTLSALTVARSGSATLGNDLSIVSALTLTNGVVNTADTLSLGAAATASSAGGYVDGNLQKSFGVSGNLGSFTFPVGTANGYSPLDANVTANTNGTLTVKAVQGKLPSISGTNALQRYWTLSGSGLTTDLTFHYNVVTPNDVVGNEALYKIFKYDGSFTQVPNQSIDTGAHTATATGVTSFSEWTLAEPTAIMPGTLQFVGAPYTDSETNANHTKTITVSRSGGTDGAIDVTYATSAGTATAGSDYVETTATLHWNDGETGNKTFDITVNGDATYEANETVNITLSDVTDGATITPPNPTTLTITNDDAVPANATLVVNTTDDNDFGACVTAHCSLREAINAANSLPDANTINFDIPNTDPNFGGGVYTIKPTVSLASITAPVTIDGTSQTTISDTNANGPEIELNGSLTTGANGLTISASNSTVKGLVVNGFANGIAIGSTNTSNNQILNNFVGTNAAGTAAVANASIGVSVATTTGSTISGNLISGNGTTGITTCDVSSTTFSNNLVGTDRTGVSNVGNGSQGMQTFCTTFTNNTISGNTFAFNGGDGYRDQPDYGGGPFLTGHINNRITQNSFFSNTGLGINLLPPPNNTVDGVTPNDPGDADGGANNLQNFPVITSSKVTGATRTIKGTLNSSASQTFTIEFFANSVGCDGSGNGEGQTYLGSTPVTTDGSGNGSFTFHPGTLAVGDIITATATDAANNTSEFSACFTTIAGTPGTLQFAVANTNDTEQDSGTHLVTISVTRTGGSDGDVSVQYATSDGTATAGTDYDSASGTLNWLEDDSTNKTFDVTIHGDTDYEANETIGLTLSNAQVASLGSPSTATITIINDDGPALNATLVVNTTDDQDFGACLVTHCSLREAINAANFNSSDPNTIDFDIPVTDPNRNGTTGIFTIAPGSALSPITSPVTIDGYSQTPCDGPNAPPCSKPNTQTDNTDDAVILIELTGVNAGLNTDGLVLSGGNFSTVSGLIINRFGGAGVKLTGVGFDNVTGNFIGTDATGLLGVDGSSVPYGNGVGIFVDNVDNNMIGCETPEERNIISANLASGVNITGANANFNLVWGNLIGTNKAAAALGNGGDGVLIDGGSDNSVGVDLTPNGQGNVIANNTARGVEVRTTTGPATGNVISQNSIYDNGLLGIDLSGDSVTPNDAQDPDTGPNNLQNFPIIRNALVGGPNTIRGTLNSTPNETFTIDLYISPSCDSPGGNGEGKTYLGSTTTTTGANGDGLWSFSAAGVIAGDVITATATDASGNTSEFSKCFAATTFNPGTIGFAVANTDNTETNSGSHTVDITVNRTGGSDGAVSVDWAVTNGSATIADNDYSISPATGTFNWANGNTAPKTITITVNGDTKFELDETVTLTLSHVQGGATIGGTNPATLTIKNDDTEPTISIDDVTHSEGNSGTTDYDFTVSLSNASYQTITVNAATTDDTATTGNSDYGIAGGTLTFNPDVTTQHFHVLVNGDLTIEPDEQFFVDLSSANNATIADSRGVGTIINDDTDVTVAVSPSSVAENGGTNLVYTFTRNPLTPGPITVNFSVAGTADFGTDYTQTGAATFNATSGTVVIPNNATSAAVNIIPTGDNTVELDETVILTVTSGTGYNIGATNSASSTITNDDTDIAVAVSPASALEDGLPNLPNPPTNQVMVYTFTRTGVTSGAITVNFSVGGVATFPSDYTQSGAASFGPSSGTVTFGDGITTATVTVDPITDVIYESNETVILTVTSGTGYEPADSPNHTATGAITNDDPKPTLAIGDRIANEGTTTTPSPTTDFVFTVTKSGPTEVTATVDFATADGTTNPATGGGTCGTPGVDYETQAGTLTFLPNETSKTITVKVCREATVEANEIFFVNLSNESEATIVDGQGRGTIQNDDSPGTVLFVNTTDDVFDGTCNSTHCTLREAITAVNGSPGGNAVGISFAIPASDPRHFYYKDDGLAGQVTNDPSHVVTTTATDDSLASIPDIDPDWPHSWWSILPTSAMSPITHSVVVDGYSQTGATPNNLADGNDAVLRIELTNGNLIPVATGLTLSAGTSSVRGLVINRWTSHGMDLGGTSNTVAGNFIGTDVSGTLDLGNTGQGISTNGNGVTIGGSRLTITFVPVKDGNVISGNDGGGITFSGTNGALVLGNLIGTKADGATNLGNGGNGISFTAGSLFNTVGGTEAIDGNKIAFNAGDGVQVPASVGIGFAIRGNSIFSNGTTAQHLGIDLDADGVTPNDSKDPDPSPSPSRANNLQNFPVITSALVTGSTRTIVGTLNSTPGQTFDLDFYQSPSCDTSGNGEGKTYLGSTSVTTDGTTGDASFTFHPDELAIGQVLTATATATGASFSTSEFSACAPINNGASGAGDIQFSSATYTVGEAGGTAAITLTRVGGSNGSISSPFTMSGGTATAGADYTDASQTVTFIEGETSKTINVTIADDSVYEGNETVNLSLGTSTINAAQPDGLAPAADPHAAVLTITENDPAPTLVIDDVTHNEGNSGTTSYTFTVTKTGSTAVNATVDYATVNGTATAPSDFTAIPATTLTFLPADTTRQFTVLVNGDTVVEPTEAFTVHLSNAGNATISDADGTGTITNDDTDVTVAVSPASVAEDGAPNFVYTFTRNGVTGSSQTVNFSVGGTAAFTTDYTQSGAATFTSSSGTVTFGAGNTTATVTIDPAVDSTVESNETVILTLTAGTGYNVASPSSATGTITNDDTDVTVAVSPSSVAEDGVANLVYTFTRNGVTTGALTANFSVGGTATLATDYTQSGAATFTSSSGTVTFGAGNSTATVTVDPTPDVAFEADETVILTVTSGTGYNVASPSSATGTITNDDPAGGFIQLSSNIFTTNENSRFVTITVQRSGDTTNAVTVNYATPDDSEATTITPCDVNNTGFAAPRCDFTTALGTLRWAAGDGAPKTFDILISQDSYVELPEHLTVTLSNPTGAAVLGVQSTADVVITDDDTSPPVTNPIDDPTNFVRQHYHDFLNREPDQAGLNFWSNEITSCGSNQQCIDFKRVQVSAAFYLSIEFQDTGYHVERLYKTSYGDATGNSTFNGAHQLPVPVVRYIEFLGDTQEIGLGVVVGQGNWQQQLENNKQAFADKFVQRARFIAAYPLSMTPGQFVDTLNANAGNPLSAAERNQLVADLTSNAKTRAQVLRAVAEDQDLKNAEFNRAFVLMQYFGYLRRNPNAAQDTDYSGYDFWLTKLNQFNGNFQNADMVKAFITSGEYRRRFGP